MILTKLKPYSSPEAEEIAAITAEQLNIVSPGDGSTEDLTYEQWDF